MSFIVITAPATEPVTLVEVKAHLRIDAADSDALLTALIVAAREHAETYLSRALITQTLEARYDYFPACIQAPRPRLQSVTHIKYNDTDGAEQTLDASKYTVDPYSVPGRIVPAYGEVWPSTRNEINAVKATIVCGYGLAAAVPQPIKQALFLHIGHMFENREETTPVAISEVPMGYDALMATHKVQSFGE